MQIPISSPFSGPKAVEYAPQADNTVTGTDKKPKDIDTDPLAQKEVFLQLLVAQIKNQNPLNPSDSIQFLTQLSQFTSVEQLVGIRKDIGELLKNQTAATPPAAPPATATGPV
jgi:flagellar basal-body rod modification protein FlgD